MRGGTPLAPKEKIVASPPRRAEVVMIVVQIPKSRGNAESGAAFQPVPEKQEGAPGEQGRVPGSGCTLREGPVP